MADVHPEECTCDACEEQMLEILSGWNAAKRTAFRLRSLEAELALRRPPPCDDCGGALTKTYYTNVPTADGEKKNLCHPCQKRRHPSPSPSSAD